MWAAEEMITTEIGETRRVGQELQCGQNREIYAIEHPISKAYGETDAQGNDETVQKTRAQSANTQ